MTDSLDSAKQSISGLLRELFDVRRQRKQLGNEYSDKETKLKQVFTAKDEPLAKRQTAIMAELHRLAMDNKAGLLTGKLKSFAMTYGKIAFKAKRLGFKVTDKSSVEKLARKDGILTKVGSFERTWKPDAKKLQAWLEANPGKAAKYADYVEHTGGYDEVYAEPNGAYLTEFDPNRLTDESIKLEPAENDDRQDESPDA